MPKYIAFLRAINVGGRNVKMEVLRELFSGMSFSNVESFIASGNIIFDSPSTDRAALEQKIEAGLKAGLGYEVDTFIRTPAEVAEIADNYPFNLDEWDPQECTLYVGFIAIPPNTGAEEALLAHASDSDAFHVEGREVYWLSRITQSRSTFSGARAEKILGMPATFRNVNTVKRLAAKY
jgi:uncharacterized protein (DUF1697 family)